MGGANQPARDYATFRFGTKSPTYESDRRKVFAAYEDAKRMGVHLEVVCGLTEPDVPRKKLFSEIPHIEGERIVLDRVVDSDAEAIRDLKDNPHVQRWLPTYLFENQRDDVHETIRLLYGDLFENKESLILAVRLKETGELVGLTEFYGLRDDLHKISVGGRLREQHWSCGIGTEMVTLMVGYLYGETDIEIITASVMVDNVASASTLEKCDFIRTARSVEEDWGYTEPTLVDKFFC